MQTIGNLAKRIAPTPEQSGSQTPRSTQPAPSSRGTGEAPTPQEVGSRPTGTQPGALTSTATPPPSLAVALGQANPDSTDRALEASLTSLLGSKPVPIWEDKTTEHGWEGVVTNYHLPSLTPQTQAQAISTAEKSLMPASASECIGLLGELKLLTVPRTEATENLEAQLMLYAKKLQDYPADVVRRVLTTQPNISKWWPAWSELKERLDLLSFRRRRLLEALKSGKSSQNSSAETEPCVPKADPELMAKAEEILSAYRARKAASEAMTEPTPEEMEKRRAELLKQCESA